MRNDLEMESKKKVKEIIQRLNDQREKDLQQVIDNMQKSHADATEKLTKSLNLGFDINIKAQETMLL